MGRPLVIKAGAQKPSDHVGTDAPINAAAPSRGGSAAPRQPPPKNPRLAGTARPVASAALATRTAAAHNVGADGRYITNRKHVKLCEGFQDGSCTEADATKQCARDKSKIHQCSICLSDTHGVHACRPPSQKGLP